MRAEERATRQARIAVLERLRRPSARSLRPLLMLAAVVGTLVVLGGTAAVIVGFFVVLLALDRALPGGGAAMLDAELRFRQLARERRRDAIRRRLRLGPPDERRLLHLSEHERWTATAQRRQLGVQAIGVDSIIGTVERQKAGAFDHRFRPPRWSRERWTRIWLAAQRGTGLPPISVYRVGHGHFVRDGHHRVSVASALATVAIDAEVVELRPSVLHQSIK